MCDLTLIQCTLTCWTIQSIEGWEAIINYEHLIGIHGATIAIGTSVHVFGMMSGIHVRYRTVKSEGMVVCTLCHLQNSTILWHQSIYHHCIHNYKIDSLKYLLYIIISWISTHIVSSINMFKCVFCGHITPRGLICLQYTK